MQKFKYLVIGGGIAGLSFALEVAKSGSVCVLFKRRAELSATAWAQGGIASVSSTTDSVDDHISDTLTCGSGLCDPEVVRMVVSEGPGRLEHLISLGIEFDRNEETKAFHLHREGGHSHRRIYHAADATGLEIQKKLLKAAHKEPNIELLEEHSAIDLITSRKVFPESPSQNRVMGAYVLTPNGVEAFLAEKVMLATGGAGKAYLYTSNPDVATGDGIAMGFRAGCRVAGMEFFQFHPTCLFHPQAKSFLVSEALRGEGAILTRINGERFMERYHPQAELAPRDIVARAIDNEMKTSGDDYVLLAINHKPAQFLRDRFPNIYSTCLKFGIDLTKEPIPVVPAAHFCCGGILTDQHGCTDLESLYAAGECAFTGLHGANRLASNSLLEGVVYGYRAAKHAQANPVLPINGQLELDWDSAKMVHSDEQVIISQNWDEIRQFMWNYVGIVRSTKRLERALRRAELIKKEVLEYYWKFHVTSDMLELRNLILVAELIIRSALQRKESRGLHYTIDYPDTSSDFEHTMVLDPLHYL